MPKGLVNVYGVYAGMSMSELEGYAISKWAVVS